MKFTIKISILYFVLAFAYKRFAGEEPSNYWINYYWLMTSIYIALIFIVDVRRYLFDKLYKLIAYLVAGYWGVMAALRIYVLFNIEQHERIINSADNIGVGCVAILGILMFLSVKIWRQS